MNRLRLWDMLAGLLAMAVALSVAELVTGAIQGMSLVVAVGEYIIDHSPGSATKAAIELLGQNDKPALIVLIIVASLGLGVAAGVLGRRRFAVGAALIVGLGVVGALAGADAPMSSGTKASFPAACSTIAGVLALRVLLQTAPAIAANKSGATAAASGAGESFGTDRRRFLQVSGGALGIAAVSLVVGRRAFDPAVDVEAARASAVLPDPDALDGEPTSDDATQSGTGTPSAETTPDSAEQPDPTPSSDEATDGVVEEPTIEAVDPAEAALTLAGISPLITPNSDFYRIDTALTVPRVDVETWRLRITGLVDNPYEITYAELLEMAVHEETVTLGCVSNRVGGDLVGNAVWQGVPLATLLERAGVQPEGTQIVARSVDRFTTAFRTDVGLDGRAAMVAVAMNGEVLPIAHGFPARTIVPGLYGYVSATKWLEEIELTRYEEFDAYWITRNWAKEAPMKTQSRFDVPSSGGTIDAGPIELGGIAWGGLRSVSTVEVRFAEESAARAAFGGSWRDQMDPGYGEWRTARLSGVLSSSSWRQWAVEWDATPGSYRVEVRAADGLGDTQTHEVHSPSPDGATGYHGFDLTVREA